MMAGIGPANTKPEMMLRRGLHAMGWRYRLHDPKLPGRPDMVFPGRKAVILVNGCFWHGHDCARGARQPKANAAYWTAKIGRNRVRDAAVRAALEASGWRVVTVWECAIKAPDFAAGLVAEVRDQAAAASSPASSSP